MKKSSRKIQSGDRIYTPSGVGGTCISFEHRLCKVKWDNGREALYTAREIDKYDYRISTPEPEGQDIAEEELSLFDQPLLISREWKVGDRCQLAKSVGIITEINGASVRVLFSDAADSTGKGAWVSKEHVCGISKLVESLKVLEDSPVQQNLLEDSTGESQSSKVQALVKFCDRNSDIPSGKEISEDFTQAQANTTSLSVDSPAPTPVEPVIELELLTPIQNQGQCSESSLELSENQDPHLSFWSNLPDLSIEDLERGLEDSSWADIKASIQSSRALINLGRNLRGKDYLSFPTLLSGQGRKHRDVGTTECETWWKKHIIQVPGSQLSASAIAMLHGFPANWFTAISPPLLAAIKDIQEDLQPENLEAKPLQSPRPELPSNGLNGYGQSFPHSLEKFDFYITVPAGIERPDLMPNELCYLFVASSFWNRSRAKTKSFPRYPNFPQGVRTAADSGGYIAARDWGGRYPYTPAQYVEWLLNWCNNWAATMDYPCEPPLTGGDKRKIRHRQKQTTKLAWLFWNNYRNVSWQWMPTIQGWDTEDYIRHAQELKPLIEQMRLHYGESFCVGIGTLCSRTSNAQIQEIVEAISAALPGIQFHLWGVKQGAASIIKFLPQVVSSDSAAWDGLAGSRCRKIWEEQYKGKISQAEYSWTIALPKYINSLEKKLGVSVRHSSLDLGDRPISLEKQSKQTGSLYQYTANRRGKDGIIREYPVVEGERHRDNDEHWYWGLSYIEKNHRGKWCDRSASIPSKSLTLARQLMREKFLYTNTIAISQLKFLWMEEKGRYLIGEIKPEACPRLCVVSLDEKNYILADANWGELRVGDRMAISRKIREAIERYQPLSVIRGLLS